MSEEKLNLAMLERFPFLARYIKCPSVYDLYLEPVTLELALTCARDRSEFALQEIKIALLDVAGDAIGFVGQRPKVIPATKLLGWTIHPQTTATEHFDETVEQAVRRFSKPVHWVLIIMTGNHVGSFKACMYFAPESETINECLARLSEEARLAEEASRAEYFSREARLQEEALTEQRSLLEKKLGHV